MSKLLKRVGALLTAGVMSLSIAAIGALADPILPENDPEQGELIIHKYQVDDFNHYDLPADGTKITDDTTVIGNDGTGDIEFQDLEPLGGVTFIVYKVQDDPADAASAVPDLKSTVVDPSNPDPSEYVYYAEGTTLSDGTATFSNMPIGTYLVTEVENSAIKTPVQPFLVDVPMTDPTTGTDWMYEVHVYPKNVLTDGPEIDKFITQENNKYDSYDIHSYIKWIITAEIPFGIEDAQGYVITDKLDPRLTYADASSTPAADDLAVTYVDAQNGNTVETLTEGTGNDYTLTKSGTAGTDESLVITLTEDGRDKLANAFDSYDADNDPLPKLTITFYTKYNLSGSDIDDNNATYIPNGAELAYANELGVDYNAKVEDEPKTYYGGLRLIKLDSAGTAQNPIPLAGAQFKIYSTEADAKAGTNAFKAADGSDLVLTTDGSGYALFSGLEFGTTGNEIDDAGNEAAYWLVEIQAPIDSDGNYYNLLKDPVKVTVDSVSHLETNSVEVFNSTGWELPMTGGMGTLIFTIVGLALIGMACILLVSSRKKKKN